MKITVAALTVFSAVHVAAASWITFPPRATALGPGPSSRSDRHRRSSRSLSSSHFIGNTVRVLKTRGSTDLSDVHDLLYLANLTVGGAQYTVHLDSGSSDLVLFTNVPNSKPSGIKYNITYGVGYAYGDISTAEVSFVDLTVSSQAILVSTSFQNPVTDYGAHGILGLGFDSLSNIDAAVANYNESWGKTFLYNVFAQSPTEPNFITFSLIRSPNDTKTDEGGFSIGQVDPEYSAVTATPSMSTWPIKNPTRWNILVDAYETLSGNHTFKSAVPEVPNGQGVLLLDTGSSYVYAPQDLVTAMYQHVSGAKYSQSEGQWIVPCDQQVFIGFWMGSRRFDLHPLDLVMPSIADATQCVGTFIPHPLAVGSGEFDILAGDVFIRNVYTLFDFGDFKDSSNLTMGDPYVKLLSKTNISNATLEFQKIRGGTSLLNITNPTNSGSGGVSSGGGGGGTSTSSPSPGSTAAGISLADLQRKIDHLQNMEPIFFAVLGANALVMATAVGLGIWFCCCRRRKKGTSGAGSGGTRWPPGRSGKRARLTSTAGNTLSAMELTTKEENGSSYAAVSLQNPDGEPLTPPAIRSGHYEGFPGDRQSTISWRQDDPFRHSRTLSGLSAFRPMMATPTGAAINVRGPDPQTPVSPSEGGFDTAELTVPLPERARVLSMPMPSTDALRQRGNNAMPPPPGAMVVPPAERSRHVSSGALTNTPPTIPEAEQSNNASTRTGGGFVRQPSPLSSPAVVAERSSNLDVPSTSLSPPQPQPQPEGSSSSPLQNGNSNTSASLTPPQQEHSAVPVPGVGLPFPISSPLPSSSPTADQQNDEIVTATTMPAVRDTPGQGS